MKICIRIKLHIFLTILYSVYIVGTWKPNGLEKRVYMPRIIKEKKHTGRHKRTSNGKSMQQQCILSIVWSQAFSFPASVSRYYRAKWLPSKVCSRFEFQFGHSNIEFICNTNFWRSRWFIKFKNQLKHSKMAFFTKIINKNIYKICL